MGGIKVETVNLDLVDEERAREIAQVSRVGVAPWLRIDDSSAAQVMHALVAKTIGHQECPNVPHLFVYALATGVVSTVTGSRYRYEQPFDSYELLEPEQMYFSLFDLVDRLPQNNSGINERFLCYMRKLTVPELKLNLEPLERNSWVCFASEQRSLWLHYYGCLMRSIDTLDPNLVKSGLVKLEELDEEVREAIENCAPGVSSHCEIACEYIRTRYRR